MSQPAQHELPGAWGDKASDYEALFMPLAAEVANRAIALSAIDGGQRFLDVAAGTGAMTLAAHYAGAEVVAVDFSERMLDLLRGKLEELSIPGIEVSTMDAQALDFPDNSFDSAGCGLALMFFSNQASALAELRRVVKPGGLAVVTTTGHTGSSRLHQLVEQALATVGTPAPTAAAGMGRAPTAEALASGLSGAGFNHVRVEPIRVPWPIPDPQVFWDRWALDAPPAPGPAQAIPADVRAAAGREFVRLVREAGRRAFDVEAFVGLGAA